MAFDISHTRMVAMRVREQLLPQPEFTPLIIACFQMNQTQVNAAIARLSQTDASAMPTQKVATVNRKLAAVSDLLADLAETIDSTIAQTTHEGGGSGDSAAHSDDCHVQATPKDLSDLPAEPIIALSDVSTIGRFKSTARHFTNAVRPLVRRIRLPKAIERAGVSGVVQFDDQLSDGDVMKAMWVVEEGGEGGWGEVADTLRFTEPFGYCQLPVTDFLALPRFCAQWMLVGRYVALRRPTGQQDGTLQLFRNNNEIRAIRNEPGFTITPNPPLPQPSRPVHPLSQHPFTHHAKPHDPPVRSRIVWQHGVGWATAGVNDREVYASASSLLKELLLCHREFAVGGFTYSPTVVVDRSVRGGHLERIMTRSRHTALDGCSDVLTSEGANGACGQSHVLTTSADPFITLMYFVIPPVNYQDVHVTTTTSEAPAAGVPQDAPFAHRFPRTAAKVRPVLGPIASIVLDGQPR
ncbi:unnamed protein product [Vitrella brassicaformis CCMP3155]|uniref:Uncharacterized protein n=1 Tax=Vitrella brassicaformis (strain CCMP3155) TaxID=1169540 RepID=A0A0G4ENF3_VITBC|nr:unnamed protein product [Vitrella brassicaformis CCMP3155]|eukprot:CEL99372.1 unnamed protein product [Vitrella brassicaformis CCMP3155]